MFRQAAGLLEQDGMSAAVLHLPTVKPLDVEAILDRAAQVPVIVTAEEHTVIGGLGSAVAEIIAEANFDPAKRFKRIGIPDVFADKYGSQDSLMERYSITGSHMTTHTGMSCSAKSAATLRACLWPGSSWSGRIATSATWSWAV